MMNSTQKQLSLNRAASKSKFLSVQLLSLMLAAQSAWAWNLLHTEANIGWGTPTVTDLLYTNGDATLSATRSYTHGAATFFAGISGEADYGRLRTLSSASVANGDLSFASDHVSWVEAEYICDIVVAPGPSVRVSGGYATFLFRLSGSVSSSSNSVATYGEVDVMANSTDQILYQRFTNSPPAGYLVSVPMLIRFSEATPIAAKLTSFVEITSLTDASGIADFSHTFTFEGMTLAETNGTPITDFTCHQIIPNPLLTCRSSDKGRLLLNLLAPAYTSQILQWTSSLAGQPVWNNHSTNDIPASDSLDLEIDPTILPSQVFFRTIQAQ